jgi:heme/copper-type cytochrome/quinol oxidase subunit 3
MVLLITTEATLFATLIASYFFLRFKSGPVWPPPPLEKPTLALPIAMSIVLLSSSIPMHFAESGIKRGRQARLKLGLALSFVLGATFLGLQSFEYVEKVKELLPTMNSYGSLFYTITGFHGFHVFIGLVLNLWTQTRAWRNHFDSERHLTVQNVAMYWHFVDAVWVFIFLSLYVSPHL